MSNPHPSAVFGSAITVDPITDTITFKYAGNDVASDDISQIADVGTIDARTIIYGLLEKVATWYEAQDVKPENMRVTRTGTLVEVNGTTVVNRNFNLAFKAAIPAGLPLIDER